MALTPSKKRHTRFAALILMAGLLCTSCISLKQEYQQKRYYVLDVERPGESLTQTATAALKVREFRASPRAVDKGFSYRMGGLNYETDFYNEFLIAPAPIMTTEAAQWLTKSGLFASVIDPASFMEATHLLEGNLAALYGDYSQTPPRAVLALQFWLLKDDLSGAKVIFQQEFKQEAPIAQKTPEALVAGWNLALAEILQELEAEIAKIDLRVERE